MIEALETPDIIGEARVKMGIPLLQSRDVDRVVFVGDTHTAVDVTQTVFDKYYDDADLIVFLGDYVDRGETGVENVGLIASKFLEDSSKIIMLRGNHESPLTNVYYGFLDEVTKKLGEQGYQSFKEFFQAMPYSVVVNNYMCVHGGIASGLGLTRGRSGRLLRLGVACLRGFLFPERALRWKRNPGPSHLRWWLVA